MFTFTLVRLSLTEVVEVIYVLLTGVVGVRGRAGGQGHVVQRLRRHLLAGQGLGRRPLWSELELKVLLLLFRMLIDLTDSFQNSCRQGL